MKNFTPTFITYILIWLVLGAYYATTLVRGLKLSEKIKSLKS